MAARSLHGCQLSFVVTARNDDHGANLLQRMQLFVDGLMTQCDRHRVDAELVLVEWNPPEDRPRLKEALNWPNGDGRCAVRIIEVPAKVHQRFKYSDRLPLFQMIAKNVGIRRARAPFVLATNIDILFNDELMDFFASRKLEAGRMYRIDRFDVPNDLPPGLAMNELLEYCRDHIIRYHVWHGTLQALPVDTPEGPKPLVVRLPKERGWRRAVWEAVLDLIKGKLIGMPSLHTNACGDFTLMHRDQWFAVRGYAELKMYSMHLDSLLCHAAFHAEAREHILPDPMRIYHIEHAKGSGWTPEGQHSLHTRLEASGIPQLHYDLFAALAMDMNQKRQPILFNGDDWGLANEDLAESVVRG